ncbi:HlyD family efflux transporter periplasmic adaptor subunit [Roseiconus nitratireducens]|uniref:HlyD family efflux transporter periplasmic adaptor subunit n=1 Tax=Roseiconus nitratireducens TaxID=2605748 RepID=A0A5M6DLH5_9BACT|nr:HlyD family efflux transporter periplasmic adaptor subunit [Roseiconus nitratireducens]KAA5547079.1 HlyD family efflux transporter periplasmic adaptor subunit [Roseiconus nitratireducens]
MIRRLTGKLPWLIVLALLVGLVVYGFWPQPIEVQTVTPRRGVLEITVNDDGETRIREKYVISAPVAGKMLRVGLDAGDPVVEDETVLASIEPADPTLLDARTRAEAEARVRVAEAAYAQANATVGRAEEILALAERESERAKKLLAKNAISQSEYDTTDNRLRLAIADLRSAESARRVAQYEIDQAEAAVSYIRSAFDPTDENLFQLIAPIDGRVLNVFREDSGVITASSEILEIGDPKDLELVIDVLSTDAVKVCPGDKIYIEHWGGESTLEAVVRNVEPSAFLKVSALGVEEKRVNVIADFVAPWEQRDSLGDGFRIEARIVVDATSPDTTVVPSGVLYRQREQWHAFRVIDGVARQIDVTIGRSDGLETEILGGIEPDDVLILHPNESLESGTQVVIDND